MLFLWKHIKKLMTSQPNPSPKHKKRLVFCGSIERASLLFSFRKSVPAGMVVEAAIVLPLFLFFFLSLSSSIEMMRLHGSLQVALWDVGNRMCVYGYAAEQAKYIGDQTEKDKDSAWWYDLADVALSYTYIKQEVISHAGSDYLESSPLSYGCNGLQFWESDLFAADDSNEDSVAISGDVLDIVMTYQVAAQPAIPTVLTFRMANRYYGRLWTGYEVSFAHETEEEERDVVYITDHASVYHESLECTHLKLSVREVTMETALESRNRWGRRYTECSKCGKKSFQGTVFITTDGDYYHYDRGCSGLKRTIHTIDRKEAAKYKPCSRCAVNR